MKVKSEKSRRLTPDAIRKPLEEGSKFGRLTVMKETRRNPIGNRWQYLFKCECGIIKFINKDPVVSGDIKSCGCLASENAKISIKKLNNSEMSIATRFIQKFEPHISSARSFFYDFYLLNMKSNKIIGFEVYENINFSILNYDCDGLDLQAAIKLVESGTYKWVLAGASTLKLVKI